MTWPTPEELKEAADGEQAPQRAMLWTAGCCRPRTSLYFNTELPTFFDRNLEA